MNNSNIVKGQYGEYKVLDKYIVVGNYFFYSIDEIERHRYYRFTNKLKNIDSVLDEAIKVMKTKCLVVSTINLK